jgi:hypothetical protein
MAPDFPVQTTIIDNLDELSFDVNLVFWVITHGTSDYGDRFVVRRQVAGDKQLFVPAPCAIRWT